MEYLIQYKESRDSHAHCKLILLMLTPAIKEAQIGREEVAVDFEEGVLDAAADVLRPVVRVH